MRSLPECFTIRVPCDEEVLMDGARHKPLQEQSARWEVSVCSNAFEYPFLKFVQMQFSMYLAR